jgi:hypothetical protein
MGRKGWACLIMAVTLVAATDGYGQQNNSKPAVQAPMQQAAPPGVAMPDEFKLNLLIRSSIIALSQANKTGNYTVLQDLGAPSFRASNDSARLAQIFGHLRSRNLDLSPVLFFTPKLVQQPMINPNGILRLVGFFPTEPERVNFDLYFQLLNGDWRIFGIGVSVTPNDQTAALPAQPAPPAPAAQEQKPAAAASAGEPAKAKPRAAAKKETATPSPKPKPAEAKKQPPTETAVENSTTSNAVRIDLGKAWRAKPE